MVRPGRICQDRRRRVRDGSEEAPAAHRTEQMKGAILHVFDMGTEAPALPPPLLLQPVSRELSITMAVIRSMAAIVNDAQWFWCSG